LATASERLITLQLNLIEHQLSLDGSPLPQLIENRIKRLRGMLTWQIHTDYDRRLTETYHHLHALNADMARLENQYASFVRSRQAATLSYQGYDETIRRQRQLIRAAKDEVGTLMARQGHLLEVMAVSELENRRDRLDTFIVRTRFALADSYDRAARIQGMERIEQ
jgi:hypothetical protein